MEGYKKLSSYVLAVVICDLTVKFCERFIDQRSRTVDQMVQAASSGKQNIAEGYTVESLESYLKLLGVADGSIKELACDYEDFLRQHELITWSKDDPRVRALKEKFVQEGGFP